MANVLRERGVFWWFEESHGQTASLETSVPGALTISDDGHIALQLEGSLWFDSPEVGFRWEESRWLPSEKRIAGRLNDCRGQHVLLAGLMRTDFSFADEKPGRQSYEAVLCFASDLPFPAGFDQDSFHALRIDLTGLEEWLQLNSIKVDYEFRDGDHTDFKVSYKNYQFGYETPIAKVSVENLILGISPIRLSDLPMAKVNIRQTNWIVYAPRKQSTLTELRAAYTRIEEVISMLLGQYFRLDWPNFVGKDGEFDVWYKLYWFRGPKGERLPPSVFLWTTFAALREKFGELLSRWQVNLERYGAGYELYAASLRSPLPHPEHHFVNVIWAIESLHRGWQREVGESGSVASRKKKIQQVLDRFIGPADKRLGQWLRGKLKYAYEPTLEERIVEAFSRLPFRIDAAQLRSFATRCARRRNDISHEGGRQPGEDLESFRSEIRELAEGLRYLFHALLLHEIGVDSDMLLRAMTQSALGHVIILPRLRDAHIDLPVGDGA